MADVVAELQKLHELHTAGVLTDEEFGFAKQRVLSGAAPAPAATVASTTSTAPASLDMFEGNSFVATDGAATAVTQHIDEASGQPYWHNSSTGVTTWHDPEAGVPSVQQNPIAGADAPTQDILGTRSITFTRKLVTAPSMLIDTSDAPKGLKVEQDILGITFTRKLVTAPSMLIGMFRVAFFGILALILCIGVASGPWLFVIYGGPTKEITLQYVGAIIATVVMALVFLFSGGGWFYNVLQTLCNSVIVRFDASSQEISYHLTPFGNFGSKEKLFRVPLPGFTKVRNEHVMRVWTPAPEQCLQWRTFVFGCNKSWCRRMQAWCSNSPRYVIKVHMPPGVSDAEVDGIFVVKEYPITDQVCNCCPCEKVTDSHGVSAEERARELSLRRITTLARVASEDGAYIQRCLASALHVEGQKAHDDENAQRKSEGKPPVGSEGNLSGHDLLELVLTPLTWGGGGTVGSSSSCGSCGNCNC